LRRARHLPERDLSYLAALLWLSTPSFEQRDALRIARRGHLPHIGVEIRRVLVGENGGLIRRMWW
jgi:hypothetical protein